MVNFKHRIGLKPYFIMKKILRFLKSNDIKLLFVAKALGRSPEALAYQIKAKTLTPVDIETSLNAIDSLGKACIEFARQNRSAKSS